MQIKLINNENFMQLAELYVAMYASLPTPINAIAAMHSLTTTIANKRDFMAMGMFDDKAVASDSGRTINLQVPKLVAFIAGYALEGGDFYYSAIHSTDKTKYIKPLIDEANAHTEKLGYKSWVCDTTVPAMEKILRLYGAVPVSKKYRRTI